MPTTLAGSRIRETRRRLGLTQAALADRAGISASYLNLIEHNRRRIGGRVLNAVAEALGTRPIDLAEGGNPSAVADLHAAVMDYGGEADPNTAEAFVGRFPEWAALLLSLTERVRDQRTALQSLSDRLAHDPFLAENVHAMLSHITAIRSTASILTQVDAIPDIQKRRFHESIDAESIALSSTAQVLADYLGADTAAADTAATADEILDRFLARHEHHFDTIDTLAEAMADAPDAEFAAALEGAIADILKAEGPALAPAGHALAQAHLHRYGQDARAMPLTGFADIGRAAGWDPGRIAAEMDRPILAVMRRLSVLRRPLIEAPQFGFLEVTASGTPVQRRPHSDFALPRYGNACPLWPLFRAFTRPGLPLIEGVEHDSGSVFVAYSYAYPRRPPGFGDEPDYRAAMLIRAAGKGEGQAPRKVGTSCRICTRAGCDARSEAPLVAPPARSRRERP